MGSNGSNEISLLEFPFEPQNLWSNRTRCRTAKRGVGCLGVGGFGRLGVLDGGPSGPSTGS